MARCPAILLKKACRANIRDTVFHLSYRQRLEHLRSVGKDAQKQAVFHTVGSFCRSNLAISITRTKHETLYPAVNFWEFSHSCVCTRMDDDPQCCPRAPSWWEQPPAASRGVGWSDLECLRRALLKPPPTLALSWSYLAHIVLPSVCQMKA